MKDWVLSQEGDQWSVKFDVRDLGGHLDTTFRGWSSTLATWVRLVLSRLVLIFVLPLDFHGRVRVVRSMYLPAALHGIEASFLASESLRKLRSAVRRVVWSRRQPFACVGAVLSLLDGPTGCGRWNPVILDLHRFSLLFLVLWLIMMILVERLLTLSFGLLVLFVRGVGWFMRFGTVPFYQVHLVFGSRIGSRFLLLLFVLRILLFGLTLLVFWPNGFLS